MMNDLFKKSLDTIIMPDDMKEKIRRNIIKEHYEKKTGGKTFPKKFMVAVYGMCLMFLVSFTAVMANPETRSVFVNGIASLFSSKKDAADEVYKNESEKFRSYIQIAEGIKEKSTFDTEEFKIQLVSFIPDENGIQLVFQYAANTRFYKGYPSCEKFSMKGEDEKYIYSSRCIKNDDNSGYWIVYMKAEPGEMYQLSIENIYWGQYEIKGCYDAEFYVEEDSCTKVIKTGENYQLTYGRNGEKENVTVDEIRLSPISASIIMTVHEGFNPAEVFDSVIGVYTKNSIKNINYKDIRGDLRFIDEKGNVSYAAGVINAEIMKQWSDSAYEDGFEIAKEGDVIKLTYMFDELVDIDKIKKISMLGAEITIK